MKVNRKTLEVFGAASQEELVGRLGEVFRDDTFGNLAVELEALWLGNLNFSNQSVNYALDGRCLAAPRGRGADQRHGRGSVLRGAHWWRRIRHTDAGL